MLHQNNVCPHCAAAIVAVVVVNLTACATPTTAEHVGGVATLCTMAVTAAS
ncbi:MAG: hypothetical protein M3Y74_10675 [Chloroflexota bacterium]|nr:hypothetical protein [Chloroflexota bacterium]